MLEMTNLSSDDLCELYHSADTMDDRLIERFFELAVPLCNSLCENNFTQLSHDDRAYANILACIRGVVGDQKKGQNEGNAHSVLKGMQRDAFLAHLVISFNAYCEHFRSFANSTARDALPCVQILLRLSQIFHNLSNLCHVYGSQEFPDFHSVFVPLFTFENLNFIFSLQSYCKRSDLLFSEAVHELIPKIVRVHTALLYSNLRDNEQVLHIMTQPQMTPIWECQLNLCKEEISEFSLWAIFIALKKEHFFRTIYLNVSAENRYFFLDVVWEFVMGIDGASRRSLTNLGTPEDYNKVKPSQEKMLPGDDVLFISQTIEEKIDQLLSLATRRHDLVESEIEKDKVQLLCKLFSLMLVLSSCEEYRPMIQHRQDLFEALVKLLKSIQLWARESPDSVFSTRGRLKDVNMDEEESNPVFGFKRDIIGLIANIIYRNKAAQDYLRTSEGLAALLDCAGIDTRNPFILQWSIFAIRNALESNSENQKFIVQMRQQGILEDDLVNQIHSKPAP